MKPQDLTPEHVEKIFEFYTGTCGVEGRNWLDRWSDRRDSAQAIINDIERCLSEPIGGRYVEYRIGSKWDGHSKVYFRWNTPERDLRAHFYPNFHPSSDGSRIHKEATAAGKAFDELVATYLADQK